MRMLAILLLSVNYAWVDGERGGNETSHTGHAFEKLVDGEKLEVDPSRFSTFLEGLSDCQVAVVSVQGMVCDFCARGIEKMFRRDPQVKKIDVDLRKGKVLIAYPDERSIDFEDIKQKILSNGQNATLLKILHI